MEKMVKLGEKRIILNVQHSKIGGCYPRLFIELDEKSYVNLDVTIGAPFPMKKTDFEDWAPDALEITEEEFLVELKDNGIGIRWEDFKKSLKGEV